MQSMINDTLEACLKDEPRRMNELYHSDKISLLYKQVLDDKGEDRYAITQLIRDLNYKAKYVLDEEEKIKKRMAAEEEEAELLQEAAMESQDITGQSPNEDVRSVPDDQINPMQKLTDGKQDTSFRMTKPSLATSGPSVRKDIHNAAHGNGANQPARAGQTAVTSSRATTSMRPVQLGIASANA